MVHLAQEREAEEHKWGREKDEHKRMQQQKRVWKSRSYGKKEGIPNFLLKT